MTAWIEVDGVRVEITAQPTITARCSEPVMQIFMDWFIAAYVEEQGGGWMPDLDGVTAREVVAKIAERFPALRVRYVGSDYRRPRFDPPGIVY